MNTLSKILIGIIIVLVAIMVYGYFAKDTHAPVDNAVNSTNNISTTTNEVEQEPEPEMLSTNIYFISERNLASGGEKIGCGDYVSPLSVLIPDTNEPLKETFLKLLSVDPQAQYESNTFTSPVGKLKLAFDSATIVGGLATIKLSGDFHVNGVCEAPRIQAQLEKTARQFNTIKKVDIYINGKNLKDLLSEK